MRSDTAERTVFFEFHLQGGDRLALLPGQPLYLPVHLFAGNPDRLPLGDLGKQHGGFYLTDSLLALRLPDLLPVYLQPAGVDPLGGHGAKRLLDTVADLAVDVGFRNREIMPVYQQVDDFVLGLLLRVVLALGKNRLADRLAQFLHVAIVPQILRELVIQLGQFLLADAFDRGLETHSFAGQTRRTVVGRIRDIELLGFAGREAAKVIAKSFQRVGAADLQDHFVLFDRLALHPGDTFQRHHGIIAVFQGPRVDVPVVGFLLPDLLDALVYVFIADRRLLVGHLHTFVIVQLNLGRDFEFGFEPERLAIVEVNILNVRLADYVEVFRLELLLKVLGNEIFQHPLPDVAGELLADDADGRLAGTEAGKLGALLNIGSDTAGFVFDFVNRNGNFQRAPATFEHNQVDFTSGKK